MTFHDTVKGKGSIVRERENIKRQLEESRAKRKESRLGMTRAVFERKGRLAEENIV